MGIGKLGFGQVGGNKPAAAQKKAGGFGSVGPIKATQEGKRLCLFVVLSKCSLKLTRD
jgi:hypothetical protein